MRNKRFLLTSAFLCLLSRSLQGSENKLRLYRDKATGQWHPISSSSRFRKELTSTSEGFVARDLHACAMTPRPEMNSNSIENRDSYDESFSENNSTNNYHSYSGGSSRELITVEELEYMKHFIQTPITRSRIAPYPVQEDIQSSNALQHASSEIEPSVVHDVCHIEFKKSEEQISKKCVETAPVVPAQSNWWCCSLKKR